MDITFFAYSFVIAILVKTCYGWNTHYGYDVGDGEYIHSNDTMTLTLQENPILRGVVGSRQILEFAFQNLGPSGHFTFRCIYTYTHTHTHNFKQFIL